jgi:23S rRNA (uracil1939-C5)-methyltransferase
MIVEIVELAGGGRGFARVDGEAWFVSGALPGERVEAEVERRRAGVVEARATRIFVSSAAREADPCPVASACGGCDLAHVRREAAEAVLREIVTGALRHAPPELANACRSAPVVLSPMGWRLRSRLHWDPATGILGFLGRRSHRAVDIAPCRVVSELLVSARPVLARALGDAGMPPGELEWLEDLRAEHAVAGWWGAGRPPHVAVPGLAGWQRLDSTGPVAGEGWGDDGVVMQLPVPLFVPVGAFFQGNRHLVPRLFERVGELAAGTGCRRVVDLYGGVGFLAAAARHGGILELAVVESHGAAAAAAGRNLPGADVVAATAESYLEVPGEAVGTLAVIDPPRAGLSDEARGGLLAWNPEAVLLVGCDAARFGRDGGALLRGGYRLESLEIWDLFAGSHHAEILALFRL